MGRALTALGSDAGSAFLRRARLSGALSGCGSIASDEQ